ncbi:hypothetical protein Tco_0325432, partial [Tanacetum coccineum]
MPRHHHTHITIYIVAPPSSPSLRRRHGLSTIPRRVRSDVHSTKGASGLAAKHPKQQGLHLVFLSTNEGAFGLLKNPKRVFSWLRDSIR